MLLDRWRFAAMDRCTSCNGTGDATPGSDLCLSCFGTGVPTGACVECHRGGRSFPSMYLSRFCEFHQLATMEVA